MDAEVHYYLDRRRLLIDIDERPPRCGDHIGIEGHVYEVVRVVRHIPMCPPDRYNVHLVLTVGEEINPSL